MNKALIDSLPYEVKKWFANAVVGIITADGVVTESELAHLRETIGFLDNMEDINNIVSLVKEKKTPAISKLKTDANTACLLLMQIASVAISDDRLTTQESDFFAYVGKKIGFEASFTESILEWARENLKANKHKKSILEHAKSSHIL